MMNRLKGHQCYLVGPMDNVADNGVVWRQKLTPFLRSLGLGVLDPTDKACDYANEDNSTKRIFTALKNIGEYDEICERAKGIVRTDLRMVDRADFVVAYIDIEVFMCGSFIEIAHAALQRKPVIIMCKQGKKNIPNFLWGLCGGHSTFFSTWQLVENYLTCVDNLDKVDDLKGRWKFFDSNKVYNGENLCI